MLAFGLLVELQKPNKSSATKTESVQEGKIFDDGIRNGNKRQITERKKSFFSFRTAGHSSTTERNQQPKPKPHSGHPRRPISIQQPPETTRSHHPTPILTCLAAAIDIGLYHTSILKRDCVIINVGLKKTCVPLPD